MAAIVPTLRWEPSYWTGLVGALGTTISPYLFFWQASQEVEELQARREPPRRSAPRNDALLRTGRTDVVSGMPFSNLAMFFIIVATGATLHPAGLRTVETARQAAEALRPLAGDGAYLLYALGVIGTGLLAIPVLAGSASYAVAELFHWRSSLDLPVRGATHFYLLLTGGMLVGLGLDVGGFNAVQMLYWTAVVNVCSGAAASGPRHDRGRERTSHGSSRKRSVAAGPGLGLRGRDDGGGRGYVCQLRRNRGLAQFSREEPPPTVPQPGNDR